MDNCYEEIRNVHYIRRKFEMFISYRLITCNKTRRQYDSQNRFNIETINLYNKIFLAVTYIGDLEDNKQ